MKATIPISITVGDTKFSIKKGAEVTSDVPANLLVELIANGSVALEAVDDEGNE